MDAASGATREAAIDKESDSEVDAERTMSVPRSRAIASLFEGDAGRVRALIARFKGQRLRLESEIRGWSMSGSLPAGSRIQIRCESLAGLGVGDVVAIVFGTTLVAHRIAYVGRCGASKGIVITRGDATMLVDAPAADTDIVGRVIAVDSGAGWVDVAGPPRRVRKLRAALVLGVCALALEIRPALAGLIARRLWQWKAHREGASPANA